MMRQLLGQMALRLEGRPRFCFAWRGPGTVGMMPGKRPARLFTPAAKFAICKAGIPFVAEAMEVLGGIGYCEESELPRSTVRCRSTASGRAPAILCASM